MIPGSRFTVLSGGLATEIERRGVTITVRCYCDQPIDEIFCLGLSAR